MDTTTVALVAASLGALGAISGQLISALFTSRRESRRLLWERERWEADAARESAARFLMNKRTLYADILRAAEDHRRTIRKHERVGHPLTRGIRRTVEVSEQLDSDLAKVNLLRCEAEVTLVGSPDVSCELSALIERMEGPGFDGDTSDLVRVMRADLEVGAR